MPITLSASDSTEALVNAIIEATQLESDGIVYLKKGTHYTRRYTAHPAATNKIPIGDKILQLRTKPWSPERAVIKRPDGGINLAIRDDNYGLFFIPGPPNIDEINGIKEWRKGYNSQFSVFDYAVLVRGEIHINNVDIDCNMGNQGLPVIPGEGPLLEHSCMIGFRGYSYDGPVGPNGIPRVIYIAFKKVTVNNISIINGGYADDIWISRGYFNPNIESIEMSNITGKREHRLNGKRSTIDFSGLTKQFKAFNLDIYSLQAEPESVRWRDMPGSATTENYCAWNLNNIITDILDITSPRKSLFLDASNITAGQSTPLSEIAGSIRNSTLTVQFTGGRLIRLDHFRFINVKWRIMQNENQVPDEMIKGISIQALHGDSNEIEFINNKFKVVGNFTNPANPDKKYFLIRSEHSVCRPQEFEAVTNVCGQPLASIEECIKQEKLTFGRYTNSCLNQVDIRFVNCTFDSRFGSVTNSNTYIARAIERGKWYFMEADFGSRPRSRALWEFNQPYDALVTVE